MSVSFLERCRATVAKRSEQLRKSEERFGLRLDKAEASVAAAAERLKIVSGKEPKVPTKAAPEVKAAIVAKFDATVVLSEARQSLARAKLVAVQAETDRLIDKQNAAVARAVARLEKAEAKEQERQQKAARVAARTAKVAEKQATVKQGGVEWLQGRCREAGIKGYSKMRKLDMEAALCAAGVKIAA